MENNATFTAGAFVCAMAVILPVSVLAQDMSGIGYADLSQGVADIRFAQDRAQEGPVSGLMVFIDPDDGTVQIAPIPVDDVLNPALSGLVGFAIDGGYAALNVSDTGVDVDVDGDGSFVSLGTCLTSEGVRLSVSSPEDTLIWSEVRSLPYDTEATCTD